MRDHVCGSSVKNTSVKHETANHVETRKLGPIVTERRDLGRLPENTMYTAHASMLVIKEANVAAPIATNVNRAAQFL